MRPPPRPKREGRRTLGWQRLVTVLSTEMLKVSLYSSQKCEFVAVNWTTGSTECGKMEVSAILDFTMKIKILWH